MFLLCSSYFFFTPAVLSLLVLGWRRCTGRRRWGWCRHWAVFAELEGFWQRGSTRGRRWAGISSIIKYVSAWKRIDPSWWILWIFVRKKLVARAGIHVVEKYRSKVFMWTYFQLKCSVFSPLDHAYLSYFTNLRLVTKQLANTRALHPHWRKRLFWNASFNIHFNPKRFFFLVESSLRKQTTFRHSSTGFPVKWRLRNERKNSIHWRGVTTQNWVVLLIGRAAWEISFNQSEALLRSR